MLNMWSPYVLAPPASSLRFAQTQVPATFGFILASVTMLCAVATQLIIAWHHQPMKVIVSSLQWIMAPGMLQGQFQSIQCHLDQSHHNKCLLEKLLKYQDHHLTSLHSVGYSA